MHPYNLIVTDDNDDDNCFVQNVQWLVFTEVHEYDARNNTLHMRGSINGSTSRPSQNTNHSKIRDNVN